MKWLALLLVSIGVLSVGWAFPTNCGLRWWPAPTLQESPRIEANFGIIDIYIDSGKEPLAAYEFELGTLSGDVQIVGIERGDDPNFSDPPYYDPAAMNQSRIIVGAFNTTANPPKGKTRVARLHVRVGPGKLAKYAVKLIVAGSREGQAIEANVSFTEGLEK
jgi:hypothetical protein